MKKLLTILMVAVLMISFAVVANAAVGTVVNATKVDEAPNMEEYTLFIDESWGEPAIIITEDTPNSALYKFFQDDNPNVMSAYWRENREKLMLIEPEGGPMELYFLWDNKYLYIGVKTPDENPCGASTQTWHGDGVQFWLQPLEALLASGKEYEGVFDASKNMNGEQDPWYWGQLSTCGFMWTLDNTDYEYHAGYAASSCEYRIYIEDGYMHAAIQIPLVNIGLNPKANNHGTELGIALYRISSVSYDDRGQAGFLTWGKYHTYVPGVTSFNTIVLVDPAQGPVDVDTTPVETTAPETDAPETEAPETDAPETEAPETDAPETEAPETDAPETDAPETDAPETDAPETEAPETDAPETDAPETDAPETDAPETDAPETDAPETDAPETDAPETDAPETDAPETDAPVAPETDAPETDAPVAPETDAPATDAPAATPAEPAKTGNTGLIIGIVAAVVVVGAVVGIVLGKKKK